MRGSSERERTLGVITKSKSILTPLLAEFMRACLQPCAWRRTERFSPIKQSIVSLFSVLISVQETNKKSSFYLSCVFWSLPVGSLIA
jgi:hypothetical protein